MQKPENDILRHVMCLVMNGIVTTRKGDRDMIKEAKQIVGTGQDFIIDRLVRIKGTCCISDKKAPSSIKANPDWKSVCLMLIDNIEPCGIRTKANQMLEDTKTGTKVDFDSLNLSKFGLSVNDSMNEVIGERQSSPTVNVRCGWKLVDTADTANITGEITPVEASVSDI